jgi:hypothetical protein
MDKQKWNKLDNKEKIVYVGDYIDKLKEAKDRKEVKEYEKTLFQIISWQEENDQ